MGSSERLILVVEDDHDLRQLYRHTLLLAGFAVREAADGIEALRQIDGAPPDLIILDLILPSAIDGVGVMREVATQARTKHIPIVVVTASALPVTDADAACVLRKPVDPDVLIEVVQRCLHPDVTGAPQPG